MTAEPLTPAARAALGTLPPHHSLAAAGAMPLWLAGWNHYSIWGYDPPAGEYFAQLWPNDDPERGDGPPRIWITPAGRGERLATPQTLAQRIAGATGRDIPAVCKAMTAVTTPNPPAEGW